MSEQAKALEYAVRFRVWGKYVGQLGLALAALTVVPAGAALVFGDYHIAGRYAVVIAVLAVSGGLLARLKTLLRVQVNEGTAVAATIFLLAPLAMVYPIMGAGLSFGDALFEAVSGATTTGLSTQGAVEELPRTFLFGRAWMQWYGGLGIILLSLALVATPGIVAKRVAGEEVTEEDLVGGTHAHARRVLRVYGAVTALGIVALLLCGVGLFNAVSYTLAAVSTGGFAPHNDSVAGLGSLPGQVIVALLCVVGAIPLTLYPRLYRDKGRFNLDGLQFGALLVSGLVMTLALAVCWWANDATPGRILRDAPLLAFSAQTTAGFSTVHLPALDAASKTILMVAMLVGGGIGSTAGGFKLLRLLILWRVLRVVLQRTCLPQHAVLAPRLANRRLDEQEVYMALLVILLFVGVAVLSWIPFVAMGYDPLNSLFEVVSATGTVGLSAGITSHGLPALLKAVLCADMWLGRLEIVAWLVLLRPATWFGKRSEAI